MIVINNLWLVCKNQSLRHSNLLNEVTIFIQFYQGPERGAWERFISVGENLIIPARGPVAEMAISQHRLVFVVTSDDNLYVQCKNINAFILAGKSQVS